MKRKASFSDDDEIDLTQMSGDDELQRAIEASLLSTGPSFASSLASSMRSGLTGLGLGLGFPFSSMFGGRSYGDSSDDDSDSPELAMGMMPYEWVTIFESEETKDKEPKSSSTSSSDSWPKYVGRILDRKSNVSTVKIKEFKKREKVTVKTLQERGAFWDCETLGYLSPFINANFIKCEFTVIGAKYRKYKEGFEPPYMTVNKDNRDAIVEGQISLEIQVWFNQTLFAENTETSSSEGGNMASILDRLLAPPPPPSPQEGGASSSSGISLMRRYQCPFKKYTKSLTAVPPASGGGASSSSMGTSDRRAIINAAFGLPAEFEGIPPGLTAREHERMLSQLDMMQSEESDEDSDEDEVHYFGRRSRAMGGGGGGSSSTSTGTEGTSSKYDHLYSVCTPTTTTSNLTLPKLSQKSGGSGGGESSSGPKEQEEKREIPGLLAELRPYQTQSVEWMIQQENKRSICEPFWDERTLKDGTKFFHSRHSNAFRLSLPTVRGGILAEDMGLGKTVEILALVLANGAKDTQSPSNTSPATPLSVSSSGKAPALKRRGGTLIVTQVSLLAQWEAELRKHSEEDSLDIYLYHGQTRKQDPDYLSKFDVVLTTYSILGSDWSAWDAVANPQKEKKGKSKAKGKGKTAAASKEKEKEKEGQDGEDQEEDEEDRPAAKRRRTSKKEPTKPLAQVLWNRVVLDEAHAIKSTATAQHEACCDLQSNLRWCVTGTPMQTNETDLVGQLKFLGVQPFNKPSMWKIMKHEIHKQTKMLLSHMCMRHTKNQDFDGQPILKLPEKRVDTVFVDLSAEERKIYEYTHSLHKQAFDKLMAAGVVGHRYTHVTAMLMHLRQACSHLSLVNLEAVLTLAKKLSNEEITPKEASVALEELESVHLANSSTFMEKIKQDLANGELAECPVCLDVIDQPVLLPCAHVFCHECIYSALAVAANSMCPLCRAKVTPKQLINITTKPAAETTDDSEIPEGIKEALEIGKNDSSKIRALVVEVQSMMERDPAAKAVVFTQWLGMMDKIGKALDENGIGYVQLDGSVPQKKRGKALASFQDDEDVRVLILSVRVGACGLTLTSASHLFIMEPVLNAATEQQAINRIHRIGQSKDVIVKRFVSKDSVEEQMNTLVDTGFQTTSALGGGEELSSRMRADRDKRHYRIAELQHLFSRNRSAAAAASSTSPSVPASGGGEGSSGSGSSSSAGKAPAAQ